MDKTDMSLILLLLQNSRLSYAELADKLSLSVNAVHKRIQQLIETDVIHKFTAKVSLLSSQGITVYISGTSQLENLSNLPDKIRKHGSIYWLAVGSAKFIYTGALIRNISELEPLISYIKKEVDIAEPTVGILQQFLAPLNLKPTDLSLCTLDYRIINALKDDSRRSIADVANELGISSKTVRRRLDRMIKNSLIELSLEWYPDKSDDITTLMDVKLKPNFNAVTTAYQIQKKYAEHILFYWNFANLSNSITFVVWTNSMGELHKIREKLEKEPEVLSAVPYVLCTGYIFENWRDRLAQTILSTSST
jgi:Lrp/AsnC family leucine-responsive transcriptional regulator